MEDDFQGKTAVITGGASGVGRCICEVFARQGMNVVMADIEASALERASAELRAQGLNVIGVQADVTNPESMAALEAASRAAFGNVHVLCNNAGVGIKEAQRRMWTLTPNDWNWGFGVNVMGVANGLRAFVPNMLAHGEAGHVVNTSSGNGGMTSMLTTPIYAATKADLAKASGIENMPLTEPEEVAETCLAGIRAGKFWILPASKANDAQLRARTESILARANPTLGG